jgi:hypothetical protein
LIGRVLDLDLLFQIPQQDSRNMGGIERNCKILKVETMEEREKATNQPKEEEGAFYRPLPQDLTVIAI